jgi:hypothetical protein
MLLGIFEEISGGSDVSLDFLLEFRKLILLVYASSQ